MRVRSSLLFTFLFLGFAGLLTLPVAAQQGDVCDQPNILSANCRFMGPYHAIIGFGSLRPSWSPFVVGRAPDFGGVDHNAYGVNGQGDQHIWTQGVPWTAGVYQVVNNIVPGNGYRAEVGWFVGGNKEHTVTRIGIDPTGGTDPNSSNIVWSPLLLTDKGHRAVQAIAANSSISIWAWASVVQANGDDQVWVTAFGVMPDASVPIQTPKTIPPTNTPLPAATNARGPAPRPATPTQTVTAAPTQTATSTATATATASSTPSPTETETDTETPQPAATRRATPTPTRPPAVEAVAAPSILAMGLVGASGCSLFFAFTLGGLAFWFWRRR